MPAVPPSHGHDEHARDFYGAPAHGEEKSKDKKKDKGSDTGKLIAVGAGGLAVGALAAAALSDSSDDGRFRFIRYLWLSRSCC